MATKAELSRKRWALYDLYRAVRSVEDAQIDSTALRTAMEDLESEVLAICVPCLICRRQFLVPVLVGSDTTPEGCLCAQCDEAVMRDSGYDGEPTQTIMVTDQPSSP
jgi:hypothetical protein